MQWSFVMPLMLSVIGWVLFTGAYAYSISSTKSFNLALAGLHFRYASLV
jgi:hypothetical protein